MSSRSNKATKREEQVSSPSADSAAAAIIVVPSNRPRKPSQGENVRKPQTLSLEHYDKLYKPTTAAISGSLAGVLRLPQRRESVVQSESKSHPIMSDVLNLQSKNIKAQNPAKEG